ncbi:MAG: hypothetical protein QXZ60_04350 [Sulfolobales archaeon]
MIVLVLDIIDSSSNVLDARSTVMVLASITGATVVSSADTDPLTLALGVYDSSTRDQGIGINTIRGVETT